MSTHNSPSVDVHCRERPLLTFFVCAYKQERFIREAVQAALDQTYSPLEIVLSDDCSPDRTFAIMGEMANSYQGPHRVILNRNSSNLGLGRHINRVVEVSTGDLLVGAAGDDISLSTRGAACFEAWECSGRRATSIHSAFHKIDSEGRMLRVFDEPRSDREAGQVHAEAVEPLAFVRTLQPSVAGSTHAFSRDLFRIFGGLSSETVHEDEVLAFRSVLAGEIWFISKPLVQYRVHGDNVFARTWTRSTDMQVLEREEGWMARDLQTRKAMYEAFRHDLDSALSQKLVSPIVYEKLASEIASLRARILLKQEFLASGLFARVGMLGSLWVRGLEFRERRAFLVRLIPQALLLRMRQARNYLR